MNKSDEGQSLSALFDVQAVQEVEGTQNILQKAGVGLYVQHVMLQLATSIETCQSVTICVA